MDDTRQEEAEHGQDEALARRSDAAHDEVVSLGFVELGQAPEGPFLDFLLVVVESDGGFHASLYIHVRRLAQRPSNSAAGQAERGHQSSLAIQAAPPAEISREALTASSATTYVLNLVSNRHWTYDILLCFTLMHGLEADELRVSAIWILDELRVCA